MKKFTGIELINETKEIFTEYADVKQYIVENNLDYYQFGIIARNTSEILPLESLLVEKHLFEAVFVLYLLENPEAKNTFIDFGFVSNEKNYFLYEELVIPFTISGYNEKDVHAALEQMEEHLVATDVGKDRSLYFVERYHQELIEGIADAYKVVVTFYP